MLDDKNLVALMKQAAKADPSTPVAYSWNGQSLSYEDLNETLRNELNEIAGTYSLYRENKNRIFSLIEQKSSSSDPRKLRPSKSVPALSAELLRSASKSSLMVVLILLK